jgi:hypothetical protein
MASILPVGEGILRRTRRRVRSFGLSVEQRKEIALRVCKQYDDDLQARSEDTTRRLNRYAKYRQWESPDTGWPWPGSSNQVMPDMMESSIRMQDTVHNAVMSARPIVVARALQKDNQPKESGVDALHDTQLFIEQDGERMIEHATESFCNDPSMTLYTTWVTERREVVDVRVFDPIPDDTVPRLFFSTLLRQEFPAYSQLATEREGWDWEIEQEDDVRTVKFYTKTSGDVEMIVQYDAIVFDGPRVLVKSYDDVICPPGAANLDIPSPSNPGGAAHVILRDYPTVDEIHRLARKQGSEPAFYDLVTKDDLAKLPNTSRSRSNQERKDQADRFEGVDEDRTKDPKQKGLTRLVCFDVFDVDGDGETEDVVSWVLYETKQLLRVRYLTEVFPGNRPERPLAEASFLPVGGRRAGISLLETIEGLHDAMKAAVDQMVDNGTLVNLPWFTYRAASNVKPESLRPGPGDGIPLNDPKNDLVVQPFRNDGQAFWLNLLAMLRQQSERLTLQGDLQAGRVPGGASSALRTLGGIQTLLSQGEARPERILRRFFMALRKMTRQMHRLNRYYLSDAKKFRASPTILKPEQDPYFTIANSDIDLDLEFDFHANVLNSSKQAVQQGLQAIAGMYISEIAMQTGISTPETIYRLLRDLGQAFGQNVDDYLQAPTSGARESRIDASTAMLQCSRGVFPVGVPLEGPTEHLAQLQKITETDSFGEFPPTHLPILRAYLQQVAATAQQQQQLEAQAQAAGPFGAPVGETPGRPGRPPGPPMGESDPAMLQGTELSDESLPGARGAVQ